MPMGQSVAVTPLQIVMGMSVIANGGKLMRPQIIKSIKDSDGQRFSP
jgi:cell division protein FtsI/penicillin-binding protein 2